MNTYNCEKCGKSLSDCKVADYLNRTFTWQQAHGPWLACDAFVLGDFGGHYKVVNLLQISCPKSDILVIF